jgi:hypothetical protein
MQLNVGGTFDTVDAEILGTLGTLLLAGAVATVGQSLRETRRAPALGLALAAGAPVLTAVALAAIWNAFDSDALGRTAGVAYVLLLTGLVVGTGRQLAGDRRTLLPLFLTLCALSAAGAALSITAILGGHLGPGLAKTIAAAWILAALAYVLLPVARRLTAEAPVAPAPLDLRAGAEAPGSRVRLVEADTTLAGAALVVVLTGEARAGAATLGAAEAVVSPPGTRLALQPGARALLVGR